MHTTVNKEALHETKEENDEMEVGPGTGAAQESATLPD